MTLRYPLAEGITFFFVCAGCKSQHKTTIPRHEAPFMWRCPREGCEWIVTMQSDETGISTGYTAPMLRKPKLELVK